METLNIPLPVDLAKWFGVEDIPQEAVRLIALELFRQEKISLGLAARLSGTPLAAFMDYAAKRGVPPLRYDLEDIEEEWRSIERLGR